MDLPGKVLACTSLLLLFNANHVLTLLPPHAL